MQLILYAKILCLDGVVRAKLFSRALSRSRFWELGYLIYFVGAGHCGESLACCPVVNTAVLYSGYLVQRSAGLDGNDRQWLRFAPVSWKLGACYRSGSFFGKRVVEKCGKWSLRPAC